MSKDAAELFAIGSVTISGLKAEYGISRTKAYELMNDGSLPWTASTGRRLIPRAAVVRLLASGLNDHKNTVPGL